MSVVLPTYRPGGIELAKRSLLQQTFRDFEVIIADEHVLHRRARWESALLEGPSALRPERLKFADMSRSAFPRSSAPVAHNEAARISSGELLVFLSDYALCAPDWLERHWRVWKESAKRFVCSAPFVYVTAPEEWLRVPPPIRVDAGFMEENGIAYSIFKDSEERDWDALPAQTRNFARPEDHWKTATVGWQDPKLTMRDGAPCDWQMYYNKNESVPLEKFLDVNGADESFCGLHPYDDAALALRLYASGVRWRVDHKATIQVVQVRQWMHYTKWDAPASEPEKLFRRITAAIAAGGSPRTPNPFDLRALRETSCTKCDYAHALYKPCAFGAGVG